MNTAPLRSPGRRPRHRRLPRPAARAAAWLALLGLLAPGVVLAQDAAAGGMSFMQCSECHATGSGNGAGPSLKGIVGRRAGTYPGFAFSDAMKKSGITWDARTLDAYLAAPQKLVPGNAMQVDGIADAKDRADLVAYLATLK